VYGQGCAYKKHKDQFKTDNNRKFSLICYLNDDGVAATGGQLVVYKNGEAQTISPNAQKEVFFKSNEMEHDALLTNKPMMSITGWLKKYKTSPLRKDLIEVTLSKYMIS
jgi:SM-20-related protein